MMEIALIENIQRENLNPIEEAMAYDNILKSSNMTQDELAKKFGKSRSYITNILGLLKLPETTKKYVEENKLTMSHARALSKLEDEEQIDRLADKIITEGLNVRTIENIARDEALPKINPQHTTKVSDSNKYIIYENALREKTGTRAKIGNKKIEIPFNSTQELERILESLNIEIEG